MFETPLSVSESIEHKPENTHIPGAAWNESHLAPNTPNPDPDSINPDVLREPDYRDDLGASSPFVFFVVFL